MGFMVGSGPARYFSGVITAIAAGVATVRVTDQPDTDGQPADVLATGTGTVNDKVTVMVTPDGRAVIIGR